VSRSSKARTDTQAPCLFLAEWSVLTPTSLDDRLLLVVRGRTLQELSP